MIDTPTTLTVKTTEGNARIVLDMLGEIERSTEKHGVQRHHTIGFSNPDAAPFRDLVQKQVDEGMKDGTVTWEQIIQEEFMEAVVETEPAAIRAELVQMLAVVAKTIDAIDAQESA